MSPPPLGSLIQIDVPKFRSQTTSPFHAPKDPLQSSGSDSVVVAFVAGARAFSFGLSRSLSVRFSATFAIVGSCLTAQKAEETSVDDTQFKCNKTFEESAAAAAAAQQRERNQQKMGRRRRRRRRARWVVRRRRSGYP